jgi:hypothetical protein
MAKFDANAFNRKAPTRTACEQQYTLIGRIAYYLIVPLLAGLIVMTAIPGVLFILSVLGLVPNDWMTQELSTRTLTVMLAVAVFVVFYFPTGRVTASALHALASRGWPLLRCPQTPANSE